MFFFVSITIKYADFKYILLNTVKVNNYADSGDVKHWSVTNNYTDVNLMAVLKTGL